MARFHACCRPPLTPAALVLPQERTLWVSNLPEPIAFFDNKLKALFAQFGEVIAVTCRCAIHGRSWALVTFADAQSVRVAVAKGLEVVHDKQKVTLVVEQLDDQIDGETDNATALHIKQKHMAKTEAHSDLEFLGFS